MPTRGGVPLQFQALKARGMSPGVLIFERLRVSLRYWWKWRPQGGALFGVVHAAGLSCIQPARLLEPSYYRDVMLVNTEAALALARGFLSKKVSEPSGGYIVFVSSVMAWAGSPGAVAYGMSKAALTGMAKALAVELAPRKIRVNCVAPRFVKIPMFDRVFGMWDADQRSRVESEHPLGLGEPADVANAIAFFLADSGR